MLVSSSGHLKTTFIKILTRYGDFRGMSDLTVRGLDFVRDQIIDNVFGTIGLYELQKLYARRAEVAKNMEMAICALIEEGYGLPNWKDQSMPVSLARCLVVSGLTRAWHDQMISQWKDGMLRRHIICHYSLSDPKMLADAVERWELVPLARRELPFTPTTPIRMLITERERRQVRGWFMKYRGDEPVTPLQVYIKAMSVLRWHRQMNGRKDDTMERGEEFAQTFRAEPITRLKFDSLRKVKKAAGGGK